MYQRKILLVATSTTLIKSKHTSHRYYNSTFFQSKFWIHNSLINSGSKFSYSFNYKRNISTIHDFKNISKTFVYQSSNPSSHPSVPPLNSDDSTSQLSSALPDINQNQNNDFNNKPSLVIIIGWWNCKLSNLRKYISLYTDKFHIDTLSHIPPFYHLFFPWIIPNAVTCLAKELIGVWIERGRPDNIGFHVFSDNGTYHYAMLCEAIRYLANVNSDKLFSKKNVPSISRADAELFLDSIKSCVIDSAPSPINEKYVALGIMGGFLDKTTSLKSKIAAVDSSHENNTIQKIEPPPILINFLSIFFTLSVIKRYQTFAHKALDDIPGGTFDGRNVNYLFLYGPGDQIVPEEDIIEFINRLKNRSGAYIGEKSGTLKIVEKRFYPDSMHVQHFLKYPNEYINALKLFYSIK
ncbi:24014_t:CDS:1 [Dentiscutata erythropus]|uniref:24014_t:CDS:1 n=1 Tax=Dentiscutata erythropus TaxID=1348616 RepID=A0A9N9HHZ5_9GLOM|nr:24014_t:CDS:1 [Dentiscutata erythropus]